jgi:NAD(P)-dependent dehydrogenase (short-subunit alcohol dehydrogenase family)
MASVLITGTSTGIGLETALTLGRAGHNVFATMRNPSRAPELGEPGQTANLGKALDSTPRPKRLDVGDSHIPATHPSLPTLFAR